MGAAPAFVQFLSGGPGLGRRRAGVIYEPFMPVPESPYGLPPMEWLLLTANTDLRFQWHFLQAFTEGTIPDTFMEAPPDASDPEQIVKFQAAWDAAMEGDQSQLHKVKWVPSGAKPVIHPPKQFDEKFPTYLMRKTCYAEGVEILTRRGWQRFPDLHPADEVATRSPEGVFEWQVPTDHIAFPYVGPTVEFKSNSFGLLVTPDHPM